MQFLIAHQRDCPGDDPIFSLNAEAKQRAANGEDVINATIGALLDDDGKLATMPSVIEVLRGLEPAQLAAYAPISGKPDFLAAVADDLFDDEKVKTQIASAATPGGSGALRLAIDNFSEPGQTVLSSSYYWPPYKTLSKVARRKFDTFRMFDEANRFDVAALGSKMDELIEREGRVLMFINSPCHNPTGYSLDQDECDALVAAVEARADRAPITVLCDIAYGHFAPDALDRVVKNMNRLVGKALVLYAWSASKAFAQYGARVGALLAVTDDDDERKRIANALAFSCRGMWSNCNAAGMATITRVMTDPEHSQRVKAQRGELVEMLARRVACWNELASAASIPYPRYDGGFFTTVFCNDPAAVCARLRERGVYLVPTLGAIRVAMCSANEAKIARIVSALAEELPR